MSDVYNNLEEQLKPEVQNRYFEAIQKALHFSEGTTGEVNDALFMTGLTLNNLALVPKITAEPKVYYVNAPDPMVEGSWDESVIVELDDFYKEPK